MGTRMQISSDQPPTSFKAPPPRESCCRRPASVGVEWEGCCSSRSSVDDETTMGSGRAGLSGRQDHAPTPARLQSDHARMSFAAARGVRCSLGTSTHQRITAAQELVLGMRHAGTPHARFLIDPPKLVVPLSVICADVCWLAATGSSPLYCITSSAGQVAFTQQRTQGRRYTASSTDVCCSAPHHCAGICVSDSAAQQHALCSLPRACSCAG